VPPMTAPPRNSMAGALVVAVVDDDPAVCGSLKFSLASELLAADEPACDCLVVDQRMPGMSGIDLIMRLRDLEVATPAILLISEPNPAIAARAAKAAVPIVEKPLFGNALLEQIREACGRGRN
jgi:two-component system, LuxR family, response regulator FixJ